jgi:predicted transcriptional regulator
MKILLSIKPEYSNKIFSGKKRFEFRRQKPKHLFDIVFVYESNPTKKIVGWFSVRKIIYGSPNYVWKQCKDAGGIEEEDYFKYCGGRKVVYAFEIDKTLLFESPINPSDLVPGFNPPQSFTYFDQSMASLLISGLNSTSWPRNELQSSMNF